jgi:hypothetical protein
MLPVRKLKAHSRLLENMLELIAQIREPRNLTLPGPVKLPIPCAVYDNISKSFLGINTPFPSPYNASAAAGMVQ